MQTDITNTCFKKIFGENIEQLRFQKKISIKEMASQLNLSQTGYRNIERGITEVTITKIFQIGQILNIPLFKLLDFEKSEWQSKSQVDLLNSANSRFVESQRQIIQHYKEEIYFLRKQLHLATKDLCLSTK